MLSLAVCLGALAAGAADAPAPVKLTHDWPSYIGPDGHVAGKCTVPVLEDFSKARLVWVNEQDDLGYAKTTSGGGHCYPANLWPSGCGSLIVADGLVLIGYFHPQDELLADDVVVAVDAATGRTCWKQVYAGQGINRGARKHPIFGTIPVAGDGKIFHLGSGGLVYAMDLKTGEPLWQGDVGKYRKDLLKVLERTAAEPAAERAREVGKWWPYATRSPLQVVDGVLLVPFGPWVAKDKHNPPKTPEENEARKRARLFAFDAATGKPLWNLVDGVSEGNTACAVKLGDKTYALTASKFGMLRLIAPRTGKVLWEKFLGVSHGWQPVVVDGRAFVREPKEPKPGVFSGEVFLTAYALSATGAKRVWQSVSPSHGAMAWAVPAYRAGVLYASLKGGTYAFDAATGKELACLADAWLFHLWGDRLVIPGDVNHESMGFPCTYTAVTGDLTNLARSGTPFAFRHQAPYKGVCGYEVLMHHPFVDGYLFTRAIDCAKSKGVIMCWNLRCAPSPTVEPGGGRHADPIRVIMTPDPVLPDAEIRYTLDGSEPAPQSRLYTGPFTLEETTEVRGGVFHGSTAPSPVVRRKYYFGEHTRTPAPTIVPAPGVFDGLVTVCLTQVLQDAEIRYTLDGSEPQSESALYCKPLQFFRDATLRAATFCDFLPRGQVTGGDYRIQPKKVWAVEGKRTDVEAEGFYAAQFDDNCRWQSRDGSIEASGLKVATVVAPGPVSYGSGSGPVAAYALDVRQAGRYHLWVQGSKGGSFSFGLDEARLGDVSIPDSGWVKLDSPLKITATGRRVLTVAVVAAGTLDRFIMTTDENFEPPEVAAADRATDLDALFK